MKTTIIGSGNVAAAFAGAISAAPDMTLLQICTRNAKRGNVLASRYGASYTAKAEEVHGADLYIVAVSDTAIGEVSERLVVQPEAVVVHTSGGLAMDALRCTTQHKGVLYPLQTFSPERDIDLKGIPLFIESATPEAHGIILSAASSFSEYVMEADSAKRSRLHLAAVFAGNFTNHLYYIAKQLVEEVDLDLSILGPLILETAAKALDSRSPEGVQTGPAARHDGITLQRHLQLLRQQPNANFTEIYKLLSKSIWETSKKI